MLRFAVSDSLWPRGLQPTRLLCPWKPLFYSDFGFPYWIIPNSFIQLYLLSHYYIQGTVSCYQFFLMTQNSVIRVLPREYTGHSKHLYQQHKRHMDITRSSIPKSDSWAKDKFFSQRWRSSIQSAKTKPGADCGSDHEFFIAKFRLKLKKVWTPLDHSCMTKSNLLWLKSRSDK